MPLTPGDYTRTCPYCSASPARFTEVAGRFGTVGRDGNERWWHTASCPACGGMIVIETTNPEDSLKAVVPEAFDEWTVDHLPPVVQSDWDEATAVYRVGANRSAVVMCGRTLEAATDHHEIGGSTLQQRIKKALEEGLITTRFKEAMDYVRLIRNVGAHAGQDVSRESAEGTMRFTLQTLRLLFEVPGELDRLREQPEELGENDDEAEQQGGPAD